MAGMMPLTLPYGEEASVLHEASLLEASRMYMWWIIFWRH
jgi:hypothetical protein